MMLYPKPAESPPRGFENCLEPLSIIENDHPAVELPACLQGLEGCALTQDDIRKAFIRIRPGYWNYGSMKRPDNSFIPYSYSCLNTRFVVIVKIKMKQGKVTAIEVRDKQNRCGKIRPCLIDDNWCSTTKARDFFNNYLYSPLKEFKQKSISLNHRDFGRRVLRVKPSKHVDPNLKNLFMPHTALDLSECPRFIDMSDQGEISLTDNRGGVITLGRLLNDDGWMLLDEAIIYLDRR